MAWTVRSPIACWKPSQRSKTQQHDPRGFDKSYPDILYLVAGEIFLTNKRDLFNLCLVSRQSYFACIPWIYREVSLNFSKDYSHAIVRRLTKRSNVSSFVQKLKLKNSFLATDQDWCLLLGAAAQFTGLRDFSLDHCASKSVDFLSNLALPRLKIHLMTDKHNVNAFNLFKRQLTGKMTSLELSISKETLYPEFKRDLVAVLHRSPALVFLRIQQSQWINDPETYEEMISEFGKAPLPKLHSLTVSTTSVHIFSTAELMAWGTQNGWSRLTYLNVTRATLLAPFVSRAPRLIRLKLVAHMGDGMSELEDYLSTCEGHVFPSLRHLIYSHFIRDLNGPVRHVIPWCILERVWATLIGFELVNNQYSSGEKGAVSPNLTDLGNLHHMCPNLRHLGLDVRIDPARWPNRIVKALARWENVTKMDLILQKPPEPSHSLIRPGVNDWKLPHTDAVQRLAFEDISQGRNDLTISIGQWRDGPTSEDKPYRLTHIFCKDEHGRTKHADACACQKKEAEASRREYLTLFSDESLKALQRRARTRSLFVVGRNKRARYAYEFQVVTAQIKLRERRARLEDFYGDDSVTLYEYEKSKVL